jgi:hypothetical protein
MNDNPDQAIVWHVDPLLGNDRERSSYITAVTEYIGALGSVVVKALCCKPKVTGSSPDEMDFFN